MPIMNDIKTGYDLKGIVGLAGMVFAQPVCPLKQNSVCAGKPEDVDHGR